MKEIYKKKFDVIVAGGGVSGCAAAVSAARQGASVLMVEQSPCLGGALTTCGVGPMMSFHAGKEQVILGVMEEIVGRLKEKNGTKGHIIDSKLYCDTVTPFNSEILKLVLDDMLYEAGCTVLFCTFVGSVTAENGAIKHITLCNKDGINNISARIFVDATGDADVAAFAGVSTDYGRKEDGAAQPMTMNMKYCNVDTEKLQEYILNNKGDYEILKEGKNPFAPNIPLDAVNFRREFEAARQSGEIEFDRKAVLLFCTDRKGEFLLNTTRILGHNGTDALSLSEAQVVGRKQCEQLDAFMRKYAPGFENAVLETTGPSVGVRGSRQIKGVYTLEQNDLMQKKKFDDTIAHSGYPIDIHDPKGDGDMSIFLKGDKPYYNLPYSIMVCEELSNLIVTGRCVSATFEAQSAIRTTPTVGALGHAAGIAAAMAAQNGCDVKDVDIKELQNKLKKTGAFLQV